MTWAHQSLNTYYVPGWMLDTLCSSSLFICIMTHEKVLQSCWPPLCPSILSEFLPLESLLCAKYCNKLLWVLDHKEGWVPKSYASELRCWGRLLGVPWTARRSNQSILKEINPEYSLEGLMLKLKLQYFGHMMQRANSLENTLFLEKIEGRRKRGRQDKMVGWHHWLNGPEFEQVPRDGEGQGSLACCSPWACRVRHDWATEKQQL